MSQQPNPTKTEAGDRRFAIDSRGSSPTAHQSGVAHLIASKVEPILLSQLDQVAVQRRTRANSGDDTIPIMDGKTIDSQRSEQLKFVALLQFLTDSLVGMTFEEVSTVVGMDQSDLRAVLQGKASLEQEHYDRIERITNVTRQIRSLISHQKVGWWYRVSIPRFNGNSPIDLLKDNRITDLEHLVNSYFDPSYT